MMKRNSKFISVLMVSLLLLASFPAAVFAGNTIDGESTVDMPAINVLVPTNLDFALDPLSLDTTAESQISDINYYFVNFTLAPVKVELDLTATSTNNAKLKASVSDIKGVNDPAVTDKFLYFGALGATSLDKDVAIVEDAMGVTEEAIYGDLFGEEDSPVAEYATTGGAIITDTLVPFAPSAEGTTGSAIIGFALGAAVESAEGGKINKVADEKSGVGAFQFYAQLNTYADWKDKDIAVAGTYTLTPLRAETYSDYKEEAVGLNQIKGDMTPSVPYDGIAGFIKDNATEKTYSGAALNITGTQTKDLEIPFYFADKDISTAVNNLTFNMEVGNHITKGDNKLIFDKEFLNSFGSGGAKDIVIKLTDDTSEYKITLNVTK